MTSLSLAAPSVPVTRRRWLWWSMLVALIAVAQTWLVSLTIDFQASRAQQRVDATTSAVAGALRHRLFVDTQRLSALADSRQSAAAWRQEAQALLLSQRELLRVELRDRSLKIVDALDNPLHKPLFADFPRNQLDFATQNACLAARRAGQPQYSQSYFVPLGNGLGEEVMDLCIARVVDDRLGGYLVGSISLASLLESVESPAVANDNEVSFIEGDGTRVVRTGSPHGAGVFVADRVVNVPGHSLQLHLDSASGRPGVIPNLTTALVLGLSLLLFGVVLVLAHDVRRRAQAERALGESLAFRKAMEDSVLAGLRARDMQGRVTFANQAFCDMVGYAPSQLLGRDEQAYWPARDAAATEGGQGGAGYETEFVSSAGRRFPVMIHESPLLDRIGRQTGWICTALDLSSQRRIEEVSRRQQDRLQASARLATIGEMASLLSHELNQPLSAIASFTTGSINLLDDPQPLPAQPSLLRQALERIAEQTERAGRVIRSVQDFVRRREHERHAIEADRLIDTILPLVRMQARRGACRVEVEVEQPAPGVLCDRTMVEQVLINLARNGLQAMEQTAQADPLLRIEVRRLARGMVEFAVSDLGTGISDEVRAQLFTPFFTTRDEGMGLGLSLCRTVVEQHGGSLDFDNLLDSQGRVAGACFRFTLPAAASRHDPMAAEPPGHA